jgi:hypothetical protein
MSNPGMSVPDEAPRSSCEISTSTRGWDIKVKVYAGSPITEAVHAAVEHWWLARDLMEDKAMGKKVAA